jgi:hypothetical protein
MPYEAQQLADGELNMVYIYNVSPIHKWEKPQGQLGTIVIPPRDWDKPVSIPFPIKGAIVRWHNNGLGRQQPFIEGGMDIAMDVCGISDGVESHPSAQLTNFGVFISKRPFDPEYLPELRRKQLAHASKTEAERLLLEYLVPKHEQKKMIAEATAKLLGDLQSRIREADDWYMGDPQQRRYIGPWHRECLRAFNHITGKKETRPWASIMIEETLEACGFCGTMIKPNLIVCPNCKNVLNPAAYEQMKEEIATRPKKA